MSPALVPSFLRCIHALPWIVEAMFELEPKGEDMANQEGVGEYCFSGRQFASFIDISVTLYPAGWFRAGMSLCAPNAFSPPLPVGVVSLLLCAFQVKLTPICAVVEVV
jgi:hypothetical protein